MSGDESADELDEFVDGVSSELSRIEGMLEAVGRKICDKPGSARSHGHISTALSEMRDAVNDLFYIRDTGE